jgi:hypothetical protein
MGSKPGVRMTGELTMGYGIEGSDAIEIEPPPIRDLLTGRAAVLWNEALLASFGIGGEF